MCLLWQTNTAMSNKTAYKIKCTNRKFKKKFRRLGINSEDSTNIFVYLASVFSFVFVYQITLTFHLAFNLLMYSILNVLIYLFPYYISTFIFMYFHFLK